mgnify:CR=1 FL=1
MSAAAERAAIVPFARFVDRVRPAVALSLPEGHLLVSASTFRVLQWGLQGHREVLRTCAPQLATAFAEAAKSGEATWPAVEEAKTHRDEWDELPFVVPQREPNEGCVYVTREASTRVVVGSEMYHRILIDEGGALPKQISDDAFAEAQATAVVAKEAGRGDRKLWGETAPLRVKLSTIRTKKNGDCFFDAVAKAFPAAAVPEQGEAGSSGGGGGGLPWPPRRITRSRAMWMRAFPDKALPPDTEPLTVVELRGVLAAHFPEEAWLIGQAVGGDSFAFIVDSSLELTRANVALPAEEAGGAAYWADEAAIAVLQRYLGARLLVFNPEAGDGYRCACSGDLPPECVPPAGIGYVVLRHSHRSSKVQHYELYEERVDGGPGLGRVRLTAFDEARLPLGVKRAFAAVCPEAKLWGPLLDEPEAKPAESGE